MNKRSAAASACAAAAGAVTGTSTGFDYLEAWQGGLVLTGYGLAFAVLGVLLAVRRDVT